MTKVKIPQHPILGPGDKIGTGDSRIVYYCKKTSIDNNGSTVVNEDESDELDLGDEV